MENTFTPSFRNLPARLDAIETTMSARFDEVLSAQLEESEEELKERLDILQARGEGMERRFKETTGAGGVAEWREEITSLRREMSERWAEESAAQPWRDELAALRELLTAKTESESASAPGGGDVEALEALEALKEEVRALKAGASTESLEARIVALEARPAPSTENVLTRIKGIGPKYAKALSASGVKGPADIAAWSDEDVVRIAGDVGASEKKVRAWRSAAKVV